MHKENENISAIEVVDVNGDKKTLMQQKEETTKEMEEKIAINCFFEELILSIKDKCNKTIGVTKSVQVREDIASQVVNTASIKALGGHGGDCDAAKVIHTATENKFITTLIVVQDASANDEEHISFFEKIKNKFTGEKI